MLRKNQMWCYKLLLRRPFPLFLGSPLHCPLPLSTYPSPTSHRWPSQQSSSQSQKVPKVPQRGIWQVTDALLWSKTVRSAKDAASRSRHSVPKGQQKLRGVQASPTRNDLDLVLLDNLLCCQGQQVLFEYCPMVQNSRGNSPAG